MLDNIKNFFNEHKKACLMVFAVVLLFVAFSAASAIRVQDARQAEQIESTQTEAADQEQTENSAEVKVEPSNDKPSLTEAQRSLIDNYSQTEKELVNVLKASVWSADGSKYTLRFYDDYYIDTANNAATQHSYAIARVEKVANSNEQHIVFETDAGTHIVTYVAGESTAEVTKSSIATLASTTMFAQKNKDYSRSESTKQIKIDDLTDGAKAQIDNKLDELQKAVNNYVALYMPAVGSLTWDKNAFVDYSDNTVQFSFTTDSKTTKSLTVTYKKTDGTFSCAS